GGLGSSGRGEKDGWQPEECGERAPPVTAAKGVERSAGKPVESAAKGEQDRPAGRDRGAVVREARVGFLRVRRAELAAQSVLQNREPFPPGKERVLESQFDRFRARRREAHHELPTGFAVQPVGEHFGQFPGRPANRPLVEDRYPVERPNRGGPNGGVPVPEEVRPVPADQVQYVLLRVAPGW